MQPRVYFGGKISKSDWRHSFVPGLRNAEWGTRRLEASSFTYTGPFFVSCDHGCRHFSIGHGAVGDVCGPEVTRKDVIANNNRGLEAADLLFVYVTSPDCYGTLVEIGHALKAQKRVVICFATGIFIDEFWYARDQADAVHISVTEEKLYEIFASELERFLAIATKEDA